MSYGVMLAQRELRRVPKDFLDHCPMGSTWEGYSRPDELDPDPCPTCGDEGYSVAGDGLTPEARAIYNTFYPSQIGGSDRAQNERLAWHDKLGQAEVDHLLANGHLLTYIGRSLPTRETKSGERIGRPFWAALPLTAAEVNARQHKSGLSGHDSVNHGILTRFRCDRLGITVECPTCDGAGTVWGSPERKAAYEAWKPTPPPVGDHIVLWQTVSEGGPCSPVFPDSAQGRRDLADWLTRNPKGVFHGWTVSDWMNLFENE